MDKKELEKKVAGLLNVDAEYKELAFSQFKKKLSEFLEVGEAVKINTLGIFQMKEQLDRSDESGKVISKDKILTLVFSPESKTSEDDSIFLNLELEEKPLDDSEFDEKVFQIGIDKPLITSKEDEKESDSLKKDISNSISVLINDSEKIKNFDLWEDHLKNKETKDFIDELEEGLEDQLIESESDDNLNEVEDALYEKDFLEMDENEIFNEIVDETDLMTEEDLSEIINGDDELREDEDNKLLEDLEKVTEDFISENDDSSDKENSVIDEVDELIEETELKEDIIDEIEQELKDENFGEPEDTNLAKNEETITGLHETVKEELDTKEISSSERENEIFDKDTLELNTSDNNKVNIIEKNKKKSPFIYLLVASFFIIGAIGIYYIFFSQHEPEQYDQNVSIAENIVETPDSENGETQVKDELDAPQKVEETEEDYFENTNDGNASKNLAAISEEKEVAENIYFDGFVYNVQVSSWKQRSVADSESQKLINKGFPAFVIKVYIPKFDGDWHRVRIGPYPSLKAAKQAKEELNK
jgi:cell division septation protein DedD/nucleoid DNA-binding protein